MQSFDTLINIPKEQLEFLLAEINIAIDDNQQRFNQLVAQINPLFAQARQLKEELGILREKRANYETFLSIESGTLVSITDSSTSSSSNALHSDNAPKKATQGATPSKLKKPSPSKIIKPKV